MAAMAARAVKSTGDAADDPLFMLLRYQRLWVRDFIDPDIQFLTCEKSRRIGITWATGSGSVLLAADEIWSQDVWYLAYKESLALEFVNDAADWARSFQTALNVYDGTMRVVAEDDGADVVPLPVVTDDDGQPMEARPGVHAVYHRVEPVEGATSSGGRVLAGAPSEILTFRIRFPSGKRVSALTSAPSNLRGLQGVVIIDEASFHERLDELLKAAMAFLLWGGKVVVISTHDGVGNAFNALCQSVKAGKRPGLHHCITFRDAIADGLYKRICAVRRRAWSQEAEDKWIDEIYDYYREGAEEELDCIPRQTASNYISPRTVEACMYRGEVPRILRYNCDDAFSLEAEGDREQVIAEWCEESLRELVEELPKDKLHFLGIDFGRTSDLTVFALCYLDQELVRVVPFMVELRNMPHQQQAQVLNFVADHAPCMTGIWADAGGNGSFLAEHAADRYGRSVVNQVHITLRWYAEHIPPLRAAFEDRKISIPSDADVLGDVIAFKLDNGVPKLPSARTKDKAGASRHGDAGIALAMMLAASRNDDGYWQSIGDVNAEDLLRRMTL